MKPKAQDRQQFSTSALVDLDGNAMLAFCVSLLVSSRVGRKQITDAEKIKVIDEQISTANTAIIQARQMLDQKALQARAAFSKSSIANSPRASDQAAQTLAQVFETVLGAFVEISKILYPQPDGGAGASAMWKRAITGK